MTNIFLVVFLLLGYRPCPKPSWGGEGLFQLTAVVHHEEVRAGPGGRNPEEAAAE